MATAEELKRQVDEARTKTPNTDANAVTGAPLEGSVRENAGAFRNLNEPLPAGDVSNTSGTGPLDTSTPTRTIGETPAPAPERSASREAREVLTSGDTAGRLSEPNKKLAERIVGQNVAEDKSDEGVAQDLATTLASPGTTPTPPDSVSPSRSIQREDGSITTADRPQQTAHYIHGIRVMITDEEKAKLDGLTKEVNDLIDGRNLGDIPTSDHYWQRRLELDALVARMRR